MNVIDQGLIIRGFKSRKYPECNCYAIIISASCDLANRKISKAYYLVGIDAKEWLCTRVGYNLAYASKMRAKLSALTNTANEFDLSSELLISLSKEQVSGIFAAINENRQKTSLIKAYNEAMIYCNPNISLEEIKQLIHKDIKPATDWLKQINKGDIVHYYFLPKSSYSDGGANNSGIIVDLQEIESISLCDLDTIISPGIDNQCMRLFDVDTQKRFKTMFMLNNHDDFVEIIGKIQSPSREHLMQRFSHGLIRIGIDNASSEDISQLTEKMKEERL